MSEIIDIDVKKVAKQLNLTITEEQVSNVLEYYHIIKDEQDGLLWTEILETCFYDLDIIVPIKNKKSKFKQIEDAKEFLKQNGYYTGNLWSVEDVQGKFRCTEDQAYDILDGALQNDATMEQIWLAIDIHAEADGLEEKEECDNCGSTDTWSNSSGELQCDNCGHSETE